MEAVDSAPIVIVVAAALRDPAGRVLVQRRPTGRADAGLWEFPGGKVEPGEGPEAALARELQEELGIVVHEQDLRPIAFSSLPRGDAHLLLLLFGCTRWSGELRALHADALYWAKAAKLACLPMPPADIPLVRALIAREQDRPQR